MTKHEKGSLGYFLELAKKDGFDNIKDWNDYRKKNGKLPSSTLILDKWAKDKGFKNYSEYQQYWAQKRGFNNYAEYQRYLIKNRGFKNQYEYQQYLAKEKGFKDNSEYVRKQRHIKEINLPMSENKNCSYYLGTHIAERGYGRKILPLIFGGIKDEMSPNHPWYDFIVKGDIKIDIKSGCLIDTNFWLFNIKHNNSTDIFILMAFDNIENLNLVHIWLIKKDEIIRLDKFWRRDSIVITNKPGKLLEFKRFEITDILSKLNK